LTIDHSVSASVYGGTFIGTADGRRTELLKDPHVADHHQRHRRRSQPLAPVNFRLTRRGATSDKQHLVAAICNAIKTNYAEIAISC